MPSFCLPSPQHPRVPVLGQHPQQEEQHEDAARRLRHVHLVSGQEAFGPRGDEFGVARQRLSKLVSSCRYLDNQVFVSLANGELIAYQREAGEARLGPLGGAPAEDALGACSSSASPGRAAGPQRGPSLEGC